MDGYITIGTELDTKGFDKEIAVLEDKLNDIKSTLQMADQDKTLFSTREIKEMEAEAQKLVRKIDDLKEKQRKIDTAGFSGMKESVENVGNSINRVIKKVARWGLAIFGVRSAYLFVRQAMGTLSQYDEQLATDVNYIRYALASSIKPIIEAIINLVYKLMAYVAYIAKAWFGISLFANASAKGFQNANKGAKQLQKTLAGFDEMNILNKDGTVGGVGIPSVDLSNLENIKIPEWVQWIANNRDKILGFFGELVTLFATAKIATFLLHLTGISNALRVMSGYQIFAILGGVLITIGGIYTTIQNLIKWIGDPTWENFAGVLEGLAITLVGIGISLVAINASNPLGWISIGIGAIAGIVSAFGDWSKETDETTRSLKDSKQATDELREAQEELANQTDNYTNAVKRQENTQRKLEEAERKNKLSGEELFNAVKIGTLDYKNMNEAQREVFDAYVANLEAQDKLEEATNKFTVAQKNANRASGELSGAIYEEQGVMDDYFTQLVKGYQNGEVESKTFYKSLNSALHNMSNESRQTFVENLPKDIQDGLFKGENLMPQYFDLFATQMNEITKSSKKTFTEDIPNSIEMGLSPNKLKSLFGGFKNTWNEMINGLDSNITVSASASSGGKSKRAKGGIFYPSRLPKLAVGGIINQPGRGVPYNGAYIGERGAEAVVPLTDSQQMALLGETIGRYITVELTNITKLDGRQIARKVDKVNQSNDFVFNR